MNTVWTSRRSRSSKIFLKKKKTRERERETGNDPLWGRSRQRLSPGRVLLPALRACPSSPPPPFFFVVVYLSTRRPPIYTHLSHLGACALYTFGFGFFFPLILFRKFRRVSSSRWIQHLFETRSRFGTVEKLFRIFSKGNVECCRRRRLLIDASCMLSSFFLNLARENENWEKRQHESAYRRRHNFSFQKINKFFAKIQRRELEPTRRHTVK